MGKPLNAAVWGGTWASGCVAAEMFRRDLEAAGIAYAVDGPDGPVYADFHSLRHTYLTMIGRHGVDLRTVQELAGHSTPILTARYSHRRLYDLAGAVNKLPNLVPAAGSDANTSAIPLRLTGTEGAKSVVPGAVPADIGPHRTALMYTLGIADGTSEDMSQTLETQGAGAIQHRPASVRSELPGKDSNLDKESQNPTVPFRNCNSGHGLNETPPSRRTARRTSDTSEGGNSDAGLAAVMAAWPTLPDHIRAAVRALIDTATGPSR